jgi:hypothetical protein
MLRRERGMVLPGPPGSKWREIKRFAVAGTGKNGDVEAQGLFDRPTV